MAVEGDLTAVLESLRPSRADTALVGADPGRCARALGVDGVAASVITDSGLSEVVWSCGGA
ncbi:hypothetical protein ACFYWU_41655, partial [Streptomyces chrestomyceticus]|uniref:hypothetical protein n=1 Tax=Streptomyces chrestomyceticus TaxID=68185 RepID=UPI00367BA459